MCQNLSLFQNNIKSVVAPLGTAFTEQQLKLSWRYTDRPTIMFDGDEAGRRASFKAALMCLPFLIPNKTIQFVTLPNNTDPDSYLENKKIKSKNFTKQIAFNLIPHIDIFDKDGYTKEELKMTNETKKILDNEIDVTATCVRVPVRTGHSESINIEFDNLYDFENVIQILSNAPGCKVIDERKDGGYITPIEAEGDYTTYISRIRKDNSNVKAINIWVVSDNLLKGAALNTVQIAEHLVKKL